MNTHAVVANAVDNTDEVRAGALCYITNFSIATGSVEVLVVSKQETWIRQWRPGLSLTNFRAKVTRKGHPAFEHALSNIAARGRAATLAKAFPPKPPADASEEDADDSIDR